MKDMNFIVLVVTMIASVERTLSQNIAQDRITAINSKNEPGGFIGLVEQYGYPAEEYELVTEDLYRLRIHRIPGSPLHPKRPGKPVIYIQHGMFGLSDMFVVGGPDKDLAFMLANTGFDVWLGNSRGNTYCRSHAILAPENNEFWDYSFHEIGIYDISASIDYILQTTNQKSLIYVGHSMGTTMIFVLLSMKPEYNQKIHLVLNMASIANWKKPTRFIRFLRDNGFTIQAIINALGFKELFPQRVFRRIFSNGTYCEETLLQPICITLMKLLNGLNSDMDTNVLINAFPHIPAGTSEKLAVHYHQNMVAGKLQMYDYGLIRNMANYGSLYPPAYNLNNIITDVAMIYGKGDTIADPEDTLDLLKYLKNSWAESVPDDNFSHLDFLWGKNLKALLQDRVIQIILSYSNM